MENKAEFIMVMKENIRELREAVRDSKRSIIKWIIITNLVLILMILGLYLKIGN